MSTIRSKKPNKADPSDQAFKKFVRNLRAHDDNMPRAFRQSSMSWVLTEDRRKTVNVTVYTPLDDEGRVVADRIMGSVQHLETPAA